METFIGKLKSEEFKRNLEDVMYTGFFILIVLVVVGICIVPLYMYNNKVEKQNIEERAIIEKISNGNINISSIEQLVENHEYKINVAGTDLTVLIDDIYNYKIIGLDSDDNIILLEKR